MIDTRDLVAQRMKAEQRAHLVREIIETVLLTALIFLVVHIAIQDFRVDGPSMEPGLQANQYLVVNSTAYWFGGPQRGDVIVFHQHHIHTDAYDLAHGCSADSGTDGLYMSCDYVKRVIAIPGDTIQITATQVVLDGVQLNEPYIQVPPGESQSTVVVPPTKLGANQYFVMGDNRLNSSDSRFFGPIARSNIVGRVVMVFWPLNQAHWLPNYAKVYAGAKP